MGSQQMYLRTYIPSPPLNKYIALFTYYKQYNPDYSATRILPDGSVELLILLDDIQRVFYKSKHNTFTYQKAIICGVQQEYIYADATGYSLFAIKFKAGGSYPFLHLPLLELNNLFIEAEQVLGYPIVLLREQLLELSEPQAMFLLVEQFLMDRLAYSQQQQHTVEVAVSHLNQSNRSSSLRQMAENLGYSQKQFIHIFKQHVGVSPKYYQRIARFNQVLREVDQRRNLDWSQISYVCGYYDQAHLINDFKFFSGMGPQNYLAQKGEFPNFIPIYQKR